MKYFTMIFFFKSKCSKWKGKRENEFATCELNIKILVGTYNGLRVLTHTPLYINLKSKQNCGWKLLERNGEINLLIQMEMPSNSKRLSSDQVRVIINRFEKEFACTTHVFQNVMSIFIYNLFHIPQHIIRCRVFLPFFFSMDVPLHSSTCYRCILHKQRAT